MLRFGNSKSPRAKRPHRPLRQSVRLPVRMTTAGVGVAACMHMPHAYHCKSGTYFWLERVSKLVCCSAGLGAMHQVWQAQVQAQKLVQAPAAAPVQAQAQAPVQAQMRAPGLHLTCVRACAGRCICTCRHTHAKHGHIVPPLELHACAPAQTTFAPQKYKLQLRVPWPSAATAAF